MFVLRVLCHPCIVIGYRYVQYNGLLDKSLIPCKEVQAFNTTCFGPGQSREYRLRGDSGLLLLGKPSQDHIMNEVVLWPTILILHIIHLVIYTSSLPFLALLRL